MDFFPRCDCSICREGREAEAAEAKAKAREKCNEAWLCVIEYTSPNGELHLRTYTAPRYVSKREASNQALSGFSLKPDWSVTRVLVYDARNYSPEIFRAKRKAEWEVI